MKLAYFDCPSGISGDMVLGAILDAGLELDALREALDGLHLSGYEIEARKVVRGGLAGTLVEVHTQDDVERKLTDVLAIIEGSTVPQEVKTTARAIFTRLAEVEARIHGTSVEEVHFHELGGLDAIVDVVGSLLGLRLLGVEGVYASALPLGRGFVRCAHGLLPLPAPATLELLKGVPVYGLDVEAELVTPTGAAIITALANSFGKPPSMRVERVGYGAGQRELPIPNLLRLIIAHAPGEFEEDTVVLLETNIDNMNPEFYEHVMGRLFQQGALDVFLTPIQMKHNRPAVMLSVIVGEKDVDEALEVIFAETTTLGVRVQEVGRKKLARESVVIDTCYGPIPVKVARLGGVVKNIAPEYEECRQIAERHHLPLKEVYDEAKRAAERDTKRSSHDPRRAIQEKQ
jgi:uncharacterized protein (TIGR00299 family) protein